MSTGKLHDSKKFLGCRLGDMVKILYGITDEQLDAAIDVHEETGERLGKVLVNLQIITIEQLAACAAILSADETTLFIHSFGERLQRPWANHYALLFLETLLCTSIALTTMLLAGVAESGVIALFFAAAALSTRLDPINPDSNIRSVSLDLLLVFVGVFIASLAAGFLVEPSVFESAFGFATHEAGIRDAVFFRDRDIADFSDIFYPNITIASFLFCLSFVFRSYAVLLTVSSCAYVWAIALATLLSRHFHQEVPGFFEALEAGLLGFGPHFILETSAFVLIGLCGLCFSKALIWYGFFTQRFLDNTKGFLLVLAGTVLLLVLAAQMEIHWFSRFQQ